MRRDMLGGANGGGTMPVGELLYGVAEVAEQMPSICHLDSVRRALTDHLERPRDERQQGRGQAIGTMDVSPGLSPIQPLSTSPTSTRCAEEPKVDPFRLPTLTLASRECSA